MQTLANELGEKTLFGRTGGAATLAVGMAQIFSRAVNGRWLDLWYHFAIMFEALFILTTLDAGTRVGRYLLQDVLGGIWKPFADTKSLSGNMVASSLVVGAWGYFLIQGVRDPLGGINSLWPLFGIANQLLASVALCLATTVILKMQLAQCPQPRRPGPVLALVTLIPLAWLLTVTMTAGYEKIFHPQPTIGFLAKAAALNRELPALQDALSRATGGSTTALEVATQALTKNRTEHFNQMLDATVAGLFLVLVLLVFLLSALEWTLLLMARRKATLHESPPVWLPDYAQAEGRPVQIFGLLALTFALVKELSGEAEMDRLPSPAQCCDVHKTSGIASKDQAATGPASSRRERYLQMTERRFQGVRRCC